MKIKFTWLLAGAFFLALWFGIDIATISGDSPFVLKAVCFLPAALFAFYFALEMDWIE